MKIILSATQHDKHQAVLEKTGFWGKRGAGCLFLAQDTKRILVAKRSALVQQPNTWGTWGGAIDDSETPKQAVRREVAEESGYDGKIKLIALSVFKHSSGFKYYNFLAVVPLEFTPVLDHETSKAKWFKFGTWPANQHPGLIELLSIKSNLAIIKNQIKSSK